MRWIKEIGNLAGKQTIAEEADDAETIALESPTSRAWIDHNQVAWRRSRARGSVVRLLRGRACTVESAHRRRQCARNCGHKHG
ncbi:MAG: hypothetical protein WD929_06475 [Steroidobacteraceae bacterium]